MYSATAPAPTGCGSGFFPDRLWPSEAAVHEIFLLAGAGLSKTAESRHIRSCMAGFLFPPRQTGVARTAAWSEIVPRDVYKRQG